MFEHPTIRCPVCGAGAVDIDPDYDPFLNFVHASNISVIAACAGGHEWLTTKTFDERGNVIGIRRRLITND